MAYPLTPPYDRQQGSVGPDQGGRHWGSEERGRGRENR